MWLYWCLMSTVISGFTSIAMKKCSNNDSKRINVLTLFSYHFIMFVVSMAVNPKFILQLNLVHMLEMLPGLIMQSTGLYCAVSCVRYGKVSITSSIKKCNTVVIFLLGITVLKEDFTLLQVIVSSVLIILSIVLAKKDKDITVIDKENQRKSISYAYGYVLCNGISKTLNKVYVTKFQDPLYVVFNYAIITILVLLMYCIITKKIEYLDIRKINAKGYFLLQSLCDALSSIFNRFAMLDGNISVISVIETSSIVITVIASRIILKEKITWKKYLMILGIFMCVFILALIK